MAHDTAPGFALAAHDQPTLAAPLVAAGFDIASTLPYGDPDQHLFGGAWPYSSAPNLGDSGYQGRHRAAD